MSSSFWWIPFSSSTNQECVIAILVESLVKQERTLDQGALSPTSQLLKVAALLVVEMTVSLYDSR